jgi:hypothetical protein
VSSVPNVAEAAEALFADLRGVPAFEVLPRHERRWIRTC